MIYFLAYSSYCLGKINKIYNLYWFFLIFFYITDCKVLVNIFLIYFFWFNAVRSNIIYYFVIQFFQKICYFYFNSTLFYRCKSINQPINLMNRSTNESIIQLIINQSIHHLINHLIKRSFNHLIIKSITKSLNQWMNVAGPVKAGSTRKMLGSPRQLENAVPTSKNPHGVWV